MRKREFEFLGGNLCLDFVNTIHEYGAADPREELHSFQDLLAFGSQAGMINEREGAQLSRNAARNPVNANKILATARACRISLYRCFSSIANGRNPSNKDLKFFNHQLARTLQKLRIRRKGSEMDWIWKDHGSLERVLWPIVHSAAELLTSNERELIRECESQTCTWLFLDRSKNRTRRWCDMKICGNRAKWHRFYDRHKREF